VSWLPWLLFFVLMVQHSHHKHPCLCWDSNLQSQQVIGHRPTP
jgi:hypothetical protein